MPDALFALVLAAGLSQSAAADVPAPPALHEANTAAMKQVRDVSYELICQCGCNMVLSECNHQNCPFAVPERQAIQAQFDAGKNSDEIVAGYVETFGRGILAAPTGSGFDLLAWLIPGLALLGGGIGVVTLVRRWTRQRAVGPALELVQEGPVSQSLLDRIENEVGQGS